MRQVYKLYEGKELPVEDSYRFCPQCQSPLHIKRIENRQRSVCSVCGFIHFLNPAPAISVLVKQGDQMLLGKRSGDPGSGKWALPSGYIDYEEDYLTAAVREVKEETGLQIRVVSVLNVSSSFLAPGLHFLTIHLLAEMVSGELAAGDDLEAVGWFPLVGPLPELAFQEDADLLGAFKLHPLDHLPVDGDQTY